MALKSRRRSPVCWFGGKNTMAKHLMPLIPEHSIYVEPFGGGAALLIAKEPSPVEVYNDLDSGLVNFFRVLRDPAKWAELQRLAAVTPYSREEYIRFREGWARCEDDVQRAQWWFMVARSSFSGLFGNSWGPTVTKSSRGMAGAVSKWLSAIEMLPEIHERIIKVQIEHVDFRRIFVTYDTPETCFYCDPPYVPDTRKGGRYDHELSARDHEDLVEILLGLQGKVILSGYASEVYAPLDSAGWKRLDFARVCRAAGRTRTSGLQGKGNVTEKQQRTETVWLSPNCETG
jgi:DNA adenine methylase